MSECVLVYPGSNSLSNDNKALVLAKNLLTRGLPKSPSDSYDHILKKAQGAPFCVFDKSATYEENRQGITHTTADAVLKTILPKSTYTLIPLIVSFLNGEAAHPDFKKLFTIIPTEEPNSIRLESVFMLLSNWETSSLEVYNIKIHQTREINQRFMRDRAETTWKISGICHHSSFSVMLPMLVDFMQSMEGTEKLIQNVLDNGFNTIKAISNSEHFSELTEFAVIYLEDLQDPRSMIEARKAVFVHSLLTHNLPQSPSDRYDYVHKQATSICTKNESNNKSHKCDANQENVHFVVNEVLKKILPNSTFGLIPTIVSLLIHQDVPHPTLRKLFVETATSGSKCVEGFFILLSKWKSLTFEVFYIKIQQTRDQSSTAVATISGDCSFAAFTVNPQSNSFDSMKNAEKNQEIQKLLEKGLNHGAAIKQCMQSYISSNARKCETIVD